MESSSIRASMISPFSISAQRVSPIPRSTSHSGKIVSGGLQHDARFGEGQPDDIRIASGDMADVDLAISLQRIASGLAAPFAVTGIEVDLGVAEVLHCDHGLGQTLADAFSGHGQRYTCQ